MNFHWDDRSKLYSDFKYLVELRRRIINSISKELNLLHNTSLSERSWHLILGYWLNQFLAVSLDRYIRLVENPELDNGNELNDSIEFSIPINTSGAGKQFVDDDWNNKFTFFLKNTLNPNEKVFFHKFSSEEIIEDKNFKKRFISIAKKILSIFLRLSFNGKKTFLIFSPKMSLINLLKLRFNLKGAKVIYEPSFQSSRYKVYDFQMRSFNLHDCIIENEFEIFLFQIIPFFIPTTFIEGFSDTIETLNQNKNIPYKSDVIFTASGHFDCDTFKIWSAFQIEKGAKFVVGMHGGGLNKFNGAYAFESDICDLLIVHGEGDKRYEKNRVAGQFFSKIKLNSWNINGDAVMITVAMPKYVFDLRSMALASQMECYFNDIFSFYNNLSHSIKSRTAIKLYPTDYGWNQKQRWEEIDSKTKFAKNTSIRKLVKDSRLVICTYNATVYLETLAANIPTIIFWDLNLWEWPEFADEDFKKLKSVGIFHETPTSASNHVEKIWDNVQNWWLDPVLQDIREKFCEKYAFRNNSVIPNLSKILKEASK